MKRQIFLACLFYCFFRLPIYESIAAIFWQSASYFFVRSVHTFSRFLKSNWSSDFGHAETGNGAKKRVVLRREFFPL